MPLNSILACRVTDAERANMEAIHAVLAKEPYARNVTITRCLQVALEYAAQAAHSGKLMVR